VCRRPGVVPPRCGRRAPECFNGGRWRVHALSFPNYAAAVSQFDANGSGNLDSAPEVQAALAAGAAIDNGMVKSFECPVIKVH
jgi:hypothetical protein